MGFQRDRETQKGEGSWSTYMQALIRLKLLLVDRPVKHGPVPSYVPLKPMRTIRSLVKFLRKESIICK